LSSLLKISVSVFLLFLSLTSSADIPIHQSAGAGEAGMGSVCIMRYSFWGSFQNQANLAMSKSASFGFNYENRFGISELGTRTAGLSIPAGKASLGALYSRFGYTDFKRDLAGLACGLKISDKIFAGVQADYISARTLKEYKNNQTVTFETGLLILPSGNITIAIHLFNPVPNSIRKSFLPSTLRVGAGSDLSSTLFAGAEAEMSSGSKLIIRTGFQYEAAGKLWLRCGFSTNNNSFCFGLGYLSKLVKADIGFATHDVLGVTSSVSIVFIMK
jgi:hypothetical protein